MYASAYVCELSDCGLATPWPAYRVMDEAALVTVVETYSFVSQQACAFT